MIEVQSTQRINLTMIDFGVQSVDVDLDVFKQCREYAVVREEGSDQSYQICGGNQRHKHVYLSFGNVIEVQLSTAAEIEGTYFVLKYEGK